MYENMTFGFILGRMLETIPDDVDKREGSVIYDALAPAALELARFYSALENVIDETFADTAGREMLIRRAAERGIIPYPATYAVICGEFNKEVPIGSRFSINGLRYKIDELLTANTYNSCVGYRLVCESVGSIGNRSVGDLLPVDYIEGLNLARITQLLIPGEEDENVEHLRKRYFDSLETQSYGGNIADYKRMALSIQGVGGVKVYPAYFGGGTVRLVIQDHRWLNPDKLLLDQVQDTIDPVGNSGHGEGLAPIGHRVSVDGVIGVTIDVSAWFQLADGWKFEDVKDDLEDILGEYLKQVSATWGQQSLRGELGGLVIRASHIESRLLNESRGRVIDITGLRLNSGNLGSNIVLSADSVPLRGVIRNGG